MAAFVAPDTILHNGVYFAADPRNADYRALIASGATITPYSPPVFQTTQITFAQLLIGLVAEAWITKAEGEAWLVGTLPAPVLALIGGLPANQQFAARARATTPSVVLRSDPLLNALGALQGKSAAQLDQFFNTYGAV